MSRRTLLVLALVAASSAVAAAVVVGMWTHGDPPTDPDSQPGVPRFEDVAARAGITFRHFDPATPQHLMPETMGSGVDFPEAYAKALLGAGVRLPLSGRAVLRVDPADAAQLLPVSDALKDLGFEVVAGQITAAALEAQGQPVEVVARLRQELERINEEYKGRARVIVVNESAQFIESSMLATFVTGMIPGRIGTVQPRAATRSRRRR